MTLRWCAGEDDRRSVAALDVPPQAFSTPPATVLERCETNPHMRLVLIEEEGQVAGYFALETGPALAEISPCPHDVFLRTLAVGVQFRRRGLARRAFTRDLGPFLRRNYPEARRVFLLVSVANWGAERLYREAGFVDTGFVRQGPWGRQVILAYTIERAG